MSNKEKIEKRLEESNLNGAIYDVEGLDLIGVEYGQEETVYVTKFIEKYPGFFAASAYETHYMILLSAQPKKITQDINWIGSGFNYGSTNVLSGLATKAIMILAEND